MQVMNDVPKWRAYEVRKPDGFGYDRVQYGVREEYEDGATRYVHNEVKDNLEDAEQMAALFNLNVRKGKTYDNTMKTWH